MKVFLNNVLKNQFVKNVSTLAIGTVFSQLVVILASPALSRIYQVEAFGILSIFTSFSMFFAVMSTGRYELAIGLPHEDKNAVRLIRLILKIGLFYSLACLLGIYLLKDVYSIKDSTGFLNIQESYLIPLYIFFLAIYSALGYWNQRKKRYIRISIANAVQVTVTTIVSILLGVLFDFEGGMIWALVIGVMVACGFYCYKEQDLLKSIFQSTHIGSIWKEYISFPKYMTFSDLSLTASQQFIPIVFSVLYNTTIVGWFAMANRMIRLPNIVITSAIGNVFRNDAIDEIRDTGSCLSLYLSTLKKLIVTSLPVFTFIFCISPYAFGWFFGNEWLEAGYYARILAVMLVFEFIVTPLNSLFNIREKQNVYMWIQSVNTILGILAIYIGQVYFDNPRYSLMLFAINSCIFNIIFLWNSYKLSKNVVE